MADGIPATPRDLMGALKASFCHVYVVSRYALRADEPKGDCHVCGEPLSDHAKTTSVIVARPGSAFIIDEKTLLDA